MVLGRDARRLKPRQRRAQPAYAGWQWALQDGGVLVTARCLLASLAASVDAYRARTRGPNGAIGGGGGRGANGPPAPT